MIIFGFIQGVFNTLGTVVGEIANRYGFSTVILNIIYMYRMQLQSLELSSLLEALLEVQCLESG
jgi:hypothetical protein